MARNSSARAHSLPISDRPGNSSLSAVGRSVGRFDGLSVCNEDRIRYRFGATSNLGLGEPINRRRAKGQRLVAIEIRTDNATLNNKHFYSRPQILANAKNDHPPPLAVFYKCITTCVQINEEDGGCSECQPFPPSISNNNFSRAVISLNLGSSDDSSSGARTHRERETSNSHCRHDHDMASPQSPPPFSLHLPPSLVPPHVCSKPPKLER